MCIYKYIDKDIFIGIRNNFVQFCCDFCVKIASQIVNWVIIFGS